MKKCPRCQLTFDDENAFCTEDGTTLEMYFVAGQSPSRFSVSIEQPTQVVERPPQIIAPPQSFPQREYARDNSKWLYLIIGGLIAIVITMGAGFFLLRNDNKEDVANSNRADEKTTNSSNQNRKIINEPVSTPANRPPPNANVPIESNSKMNNPSLSRSFNRTYSGTADNDGISMELRRNGSSLSGKVFSRRSVTDISVSGNIDDDGSFEMNEYSDIGVNTGVYRGRINADGTMNGTWSKPDGSKSRPFSLRAN